MAASAMACQSGSSSCAQRRQRCSLRLIPSSASPASRRAWAKSIAARCSGVATCGSTSRRSSSSPRAQDPNIHRVAPRVVPGDVLGCQPSEPSGLRVEERRTNGQNVGVCTRDLASFPMDWRPYPLSFRQRARGDVDKFQRPRILRLTDHVMAQRPRQGRRGEDRHHRASIPLPRYQIGPRTRNRPHQKDAKRCYMSDHYRLNPANVASLEKCTWMIMPSTRKSTVKCSSSHRRLALIAVFSIACVLAGDRAVASWRQPYNEIVAQQAQSPASPCPSTPANASAPVDKQKLSILQGNVKTTLDEVKSLYHTNRTFSISFIVTGITLTLIATSLGAVESQNTVVKRWTKFAIVGLGAAAVAAQSLNAAFPVARKAAEFSDIYWNLKALQNDVSDVTTQGDYTQKRCQYSELLRRAGKAESTLDQQKKA
jgi:hypothetical protein